MEQIMPSVSAQESSFHPRAAAATVADVMRAPLTTVNQHDHVAAAAYLMKHAGTTALMVVNAQTGQPAGIITEADIARAIADGKDVGRRPFRARRRNDSKPHSPACWATATLSRPSPIAVPSSIAAPNLAARLTPSCSPVTRLVPAPMRQTSVGHIMPGSARHTRVPTKSVAPLRSFAAVCASLQGKGSLRSVVLSEPSSGCSAGHARARRCRVRCGRTRPEGRGDRRTAWSASTPAGSQTPW
jgi:CBS domain